MFMRQGCLRHFPSSNPLSPFLCALVFVWVDTIPLPGVCVCSLLIPRRCSHSPIMVFYQKLPQIRLALGTTKAVAV